MSARVATGTIMNGAAASGTAMDTLDALAARVARTIVARRLTVPAILFLEMNRPLSFLASQALFALRPLCQVAGAGEGYDALARSLEDRGPAGGIERVVRAIEAEEDLRQAR